MGSFLLWEAAGFEVLGLSWSDYPILIITPENGSPREGPDNLTETPSRLWHGLLKQPRATVSDASPFRPGGDVRP